jgi:hypothetical protein
MSGSDAASHATESTGQGSRAAQSAARLARPRHRGQRKAEPARHFAETVLGVRVQQEKGEYLDKVP